VLFPEFATTTADFLLRLLPTGVVVVILIPEPSGFAHAIKGLFNPMAWGYGEAQVGRYHGRAAVRRQARQSEGAM
jgi:hypothetical protein